MTEQEQRLLSKVPAMRSAALGLPFGIRTDKNTVVRGTVKDVEFGYFTSTGRTLRVVFKVTMECGAAKALRTFNCEALPY